MELSIDTSELQLPGEYDFESNFNEREAREWMRENWHKSVFFAVAYVILVFGIQHFMKEKKAYNLRAPLVLWSFNLALFNAIVACRVWKQMAFILSTKGFKQSVCSQSFYVHPISKLWVYLYVWSKFLEMGDTMFIVLRKKKLIFLHWFHHSSTVMITWYSYAGMSAGSGWVVILNSSIHAVMYSYYAVRAAGFQVPHFLVMVITISQIVQLLGFVIMYTLIIFWMEDKVCHATWTAGFLSFMFSLSILVLFCNYFFKTYLGSPQKPKGE
ncbi:PREDICTED: elongation of very long chain fatty acids protein 6-like [Chaetura pelagica]|uniref:elongation of very long chain fatty acids protein 6-like n=1 Tax=Chaetura pelagica TaxID=8897 RepID=UPI00052396A5|nr:PREDICTED: elongation of very long chain fatty acids protein 6-like [Chaetura pelagica]